MAALREEQDRELAQEDDAEGMMHQQTQWEEENADEDDDEVNGEYSEWQRETRHFATVPRFMDAIRGRAEQTAEQMA